MNWSVAALVAKDVPALRRVFIPPFRHLSSCHGSNGVIAAASRYSGLDARRCAAVLRMRFLLGVPHNVKRVFQRQGSMPCYSIAAYIWHCYSTPPTHSAHHTPDRYTTG